MTGTLACGHLTIMAAVCSTTNSYTLVGDEIDEEICALDFAVPLYPAYDIPDIPDDCARSDSLSIPLVKELFFDHQTKPMCFFNNWDDGRTQMTSYRCWHKLRMLHIPAKLHLLTMESHGFQ